MSSVKSNGTTTGSSLEDLGVPGHNFLREALSTCNDPLKAIEEFQVCQETQSTNIC